MNCGRSGTVGLIGWKPEGDFQSGSTAAGIATVATLPVGAVAGLSVAGVSVGGAEEAGAVVPPVGAIPLKAVRTDETEESLFSNHCGMHSSILEVDKNTSVDYLAVKKLLHNLVKHQDADLYYGSPALTLSKLSLSTSFQVIAEAQACCMGKLGASRRLSAEDVARHVSQGGASRYLQAQCALDVPR